MQQGTVAKKMDKGFGFIKIEGEEHLKKAVAEGNGVILFSAHYGSFLTCAGRVTVEGFPLTIVFRYQSKSRTQQYLKRLWESRGISRP